MPDDQEPVLNKEAALELCDDDEDLFLEIVQAYLEDEDGQVARRPGNRVWKMAFRDRSGWSRASSWTGRD